MKMNMNISLMKVTIRLLVLMISLVIIYLVGAILYSSRYWPDVYNYIHANITIKRIPTLSELNITVLEVDWTTEYTTADFETSNFETATVEGFDFDIDEFTNIQGEIETNRPKRDAKLETFENDYNELPTRSVVVDYFFDDDVDDGKVWRKIVKDLVDESKLVPKNLGEIEMVNRRNGEKLEKMTNICHGNTSDVSNIFPWIATIFIKNDSSNQFQYTCDGVLLSGKLLITAARCFTAFNSSVAADDVLVFLGKRSLQEVGESEKTVKISKIIQHSNFSEADQVVNDLALLALDEAVPFSEDIRPACFADGDGKTATTAWAPEGLTPVFFEKPSSSCEAAPGTTCATYGYEVPLCPSYGGIYAQRHSSRWHLAGIRTGDVSERGLCFSKDVLYTPLAGYMDWIMEYME